jgi:hypothetical protein
VPAAGLVRISVINHLGQELLKENIRCDRSGYKGLTLDLNFYPSGFYYLRMQFKDVVVIKPVSLVK